MPTESASASNACDPEDAAAAMMLASLRRQSPVIRDHRCCLISAVSDAFTRVIWAYARAQRLKVQSPPSGASPISATEAPSRLMIEGWLDVRRAVSHYERFDALAAQAAAAERFLSGLRVS